MNFPLMRSVPGLLALTVFALAPLSAWADLIIPPAEERILEGLIGAGYRVVSTGGNPGRAAEYSLLRSNAAGRLDLKALFPHHRLRLEGNYLNESDYSLAAEIDYRGLVRIGAGLESLTHNLDHIPFAPPQKPDAVKPGTDVPWVRFSDLNPDDDYRVEVLQDRLALRGKLPEFPAHLDLKYWRLERSGHTQLRFLEEGIDPGTGSCSQCHVRSRSRKVDQVTEEVTASIDAHLGAIDIGVEQLIREFHDRQPIPRDTFGELRSDLVEKTFRSAGDFQHDETPDSRLISTTLKAHTSLSGGLVGAGLFSFGKRENRSDLTDVAPVKPETDFRKAAGDLTLTPMEKWTINVFYRLLDLENSGGASLSVAGINETVPVREGIDLTRSLYGMRIIHRPTRRLNLQGEFERKEIDRSNTGGPQQVEFVPELVIDPVWELPEKENINRFRVTVLARLLDRSRLKLKSWYQYLTSDDPAYATSAQRSHEGFASATWSASEKWGLMANARILREENDRHSISQFGDGGGELFTFDLDRRKENRNATAGLWLQATKDLSLNLHYGFLHSRIRQDLLFGNDPAGFTIIDEGSDFIQQVHTIALSATWQLLEEVRALAETSLTRSRARFEPGFAPRQITFFDFPEALIVDHSGLRDLTETDIRQVGLGLGLEWNPAPPWHCSLRFSHNDYDDLESETFDGSVQTYMVNLARSW